MKNFNWKHFLIIFSVLLLGAAIFFYKIQDQYMWTDEVFSFNAAKMLIEKGEPIYDSGLYYGRSSIYHQILAWSMQIFGQNEFGSRILNIPFILGTALILYFVQVKKNWRLALISTSIYLSTNFTIALSRETRMYAMAQFVFIAMIFLSYKTFTLLQDVIERRKNIKEVITIKNIFLLLLTVISGYLTYNTQPIAGIFILSVITYFILISILKKNWKYITLGILGILALFLIVYWKYQTFDLISWFGSLSPEWADTIVPTYYSVITVRNIPWILLSILPIIYLIIKKKDLFYIYLFSILSTFTLFLSLQPAQHERYWQILIPIILITAISSIWDFTKDLKGNTKKIFLYGSIWAITISQGFFAVKEVSEIDTYTQNSIYQYKKFEFNKTFEYLNTNLTEEEVLIADYHSAMTLIAKGYDVKNILITQHVLDIEGRNYEIYFNTPYLVYTDENMEKLQTENVIIVIRDYENFEGIDKYFTKVDGFEKPVIYITK